MKKYCTVLIGMLLCLINNSYAYDIEVDGIYYNIISSEDLTLSVTSGDVFYRDTVVIPQQIQYKSRTLTVICIDDYAFKSCSNLIQVQLPESIIEIGENAFANCKKLKNIELPESVVKIGEGAFRKCSALKSIVIKNNVVHIGNYSFQDCTSLSNVCIEDGDSELFLGYNYYSQTGSVKYGLFQDCPLDTLYIGRNLDYEVHPFYNNDGIRTITVGDFVTEVASFGDCDNLVAIRYGKNVKTVGASKHCDNLLDIYLETSVPPTVKDSFTNKEYLNVRLNVPKGSMNLYQSANIWSEFWEIVEMDMTSVDDVFDKTVLEFEFVTNGFKIQNINGGKLAVCSSNGSVVKSIQNYCGETIVLDKGVYIVNINGQSVKVVF